MRNEFKIGLAVLITVAIVFFGIRFLEDQPLFGGTYELVALFDDAQGLTEGSRVRLNGVLVGSVQGVRLGDTPDVAVVTMAIEPAVRVPRGSTVGTGGFSALGDVTVAIRPPDRIEDYLAAGDTIRADASTDALTLVQDNAGRYLQQLDTLLTSISGVATASEDLLGDPQSDLRGAITELRRTAGTLGDLLRTERDTLRAAVRTAARVTARADTLTAELVEAIEPDSLAATVARLDATLAQLQGTLARLDGVATDLDLLLARINAGEGTLGLMATDETLYRNANEAATALNALIADFQQNPGRYLQELRLVDVF